ncbi:hypothetical protein [Frigoriflavimonas asaccharolytica]|uniref:Oligosaccharide repeat unit polymerase n=1 Tax=Frigoriflavimonas asaccharolytica TaxID=2735899 RepID=A0A8J8G873_9FLAO|nr:hypothetical protein [Frigoriflavimonas asaccharolytica]NRS91722.1 hypothetical protein [Frigoriflavimonas asaccharolytica]
MYRKYKHKILFLLIGLVYSAVFYNGYIEFLNGWFDYAGFLIIEGRRENLPFFILSFFFCILPLLFYNGFNRISSFLSIFIYYLLYVPIILTFFFNLEGSALYVSYLQFLFVLSMIILFKADKFVLKIKFRLPGDFDVFKFVLFACGFLTLYVAFVYRDNLEFVGFDHVYEHRSSNEQLGADVFTGYLSVWLHNVLIPICLSYSLFAKKKLYFIVATISAIIIYMATAAKSVLLFPLIFLAIFWFLKKRSLNYAFLSIGIVLSVVLVTTLFTGFSEFTSLLWMRTVGNGGYLTKFYHDFFETNPITYYTHINVVNAITNGYPYDKTLGEVVGNFYWNDANTNANFWATDGIAALGDFGILFSSVLLFFLFVIFNTITVNYNKLFLILILIPYSLALLNASLFSSLVTGGGFLVFGFLMLNSTQNNKYIMINENNTDNL